MATVTVFESITLDGVMQAPGRADEDTRGGFDHGGWADGFGDEVGMRVAGQSMSTSTGLLLGRRTYADLLRYWTSMPEPNPFAEVLVNSPKYVVSRSATTELRWPNSTLLAGEAPVTVGQLRAKTAGSLTVLGSGQLVRTLHAAGLIDSYVLQIHPIVLGSGTQLFDGGHPAALSLMQSVPTTTGVIIATYAHTEA